MFNSSRIHGILFLVLSTFVIADPAPFYVKTDGNNSASGLSWSTAFQTIQKAVDSAVEGQEIIVNGGTYYEQIDFKGKNLNVHGIKSSGDPNAIIDANKQGTVVVFRGNESYSQGCRLKDFIIRGGFPAEDSLALRLDFKSDPNSIPNDNEPISDPDLLRDTSGKGRTAVAMNEVHWLQNGRENEENGAILLDGTNDYIEVSDYKGIIGKGSRTCCAWIKTTSTQQGNIISWGTEQNGQKWTFRAESSGVLGVGVWGGYVNTTATINNGQWHHVAAVLIDDGSPSVNEILFYVDGVLQSTTASNSQSIETAASQDAILGAYKNAGVPVSYFNGTLDEVRIYSRALSEMEIRELSDKTDLVAHWKLDEFTGTVAADSVGNNDANLINMTGNEWTSGRIGNALNFDSSTCDYVEAANYKGITGTASRTCSAWIKTTSTQVGYILSWGADQAGQKWAFRVESNGTLSTAVYGGYVNTTTTVNDGQWHHVAAVLNDDGSPSVNEILLYMDGVMQSTSASTTQSIETAVSQDVMIGAYKNAGVPVSFFNGKLDDVRIYNRALSQDEILHMAGNVGLAGYWKLDGNLNDCSGNAFDGQIQGNPQYTDGLNRQAMDFDGDGDYVVLPEGIINPAQNSFSAFAWVRLDEKGPNYQTILQQIDGNGTGRGWLTRQTNGTLQCNIGNCALSTSHAVFDVTGQWHLVGMTYNRQTQIVKLYVDGVESASKSGNGEASTGALYIGRNKTDETTYWNGAINEVNIYNYAISQNQINDLYQTRFAEGKQATGCGDETILTNSIYNQLGLPYSSSFENVQGFSTGILQTPVDGWDPNSGSASIAQKTYTNDILSYQYLSLANNNTRVLRHFEENSSNIVQIRCIPVEGASINILNNSVNIASVSFGNDGKIHVLNDHLYTDTGVDFRTVSSVCRTNLDSSDPNFYEQSWAEVKIIFNWDNDTYKVYWQEDLIYTTELTGGYRSVTEITFEYANSSGGYNFEINRVWITDSLGSGGVFGNGQDIWIRYPIAEADHPLKGRYPIIGTVCYNNLGHYQIRCCPTDLDPDDPSNWLLVDQGCSVMEGAILGYWDTSRFYNGDYYLKIEVYDELGRYSAGGIIAKTVSANGWTKTVNNEYSIIGKAKGQTYHYEERPDITVNWPGSFLFEFKRIYDDNLRNRLYPLFFGWTHNHNIHIIESTASDWVKNGQLKPIKDEAGLGVGKVWLQQAFGCRLFNGYVDSQNPQQVIYRPEDNEQDYIIRTSDLIATGPNTRFSVDYVHYAPDGMRLEFNDALVDPNLPLPSGQYAGEGMVGWMAMKGISTMADRFENALTYTWAADPNSGTELYITDIANNSGNSLHICFDVAPIMSPSGYPDTVFGPNLYKKIQLKDGTANVMDVMDFKAEAEFNLNSELVGFKYLYGKTHQDLSNVYVMDDRQKFVYSKNEENYYLSQVCLAQIIPLSGSGIWPAKTFEITRDINNNVWYITSNHNPWAGSGWHEFKTIFKNEYDSSGNLTSLSEYWLNRSSYCDRCPLYLKTEESVYNDNGSLYQQLTKVDKNKRCQPYSTELFPAVLSAVSYMYDPNCFSAYGLEEYIYNTGNYNPGGPVRNYVYEYMDNRFPQKPTTIYEYNDKDGNGDTDQLNKTITYQYDSRGNTIEQRVYVDVTRFVLTQHEYHPFYNFPIRQTTWQGYCHESSGQIVTSGAKVEKQWIYGKADGTIDQNVDQNNKYLVQEWKLLDDQGTVSESDDVWAVACYTYNAAGQVLTKSTLQDTNHNSQVWSTDYYQYDENGFLVKVWNGANPSTKNPQKRYHYNLAGVQTMEADYLGKVLCRTLDGWGRVLEERIYQDIDAMTCSDFTPSHYDSIAYLSITRYEEYNYYGHPFWIDMPYGGYIAQTRDNDQTYYDIMYSEDQWYLGNWSDTISNDFTEDITILRKTYIDEGFNHFITNNIVDSFNRVNYEYQYNHSDGYSDQWVPIPLSLHAIKASEYGYHPSGQKSFEKTYKAPAAGYISFAPWYDPGNVSYEAYYNCTPILEKYIQYDYDVLDRLVWQETSTDPNDPNNLDKKIITQFGYDALGNRIYVVDPNENVIFTDYDNANRKIREYFVVPAVQVVWDENDYLNVDATKAIAKCRQLTTYYTDSKVESVIQYDYDGTTPLAYTHYTYDARGRIVSVSQQKDASITATTIYMYSDAGDEQEMRRPNDPNKYQIKITGAENKNTWINVNCHGKIGMVVYPSGDYESISYYGFGLPYQKTVWNSSGTPKTITYEYDKFGKVKKIKYPDYTFQDDGMGGIVPGSEHDFISYEYTQRAVSEYGRVSKITDCRADTDRPGAEGSTYEFEYEPWSGNLATYTNPDEVTISYDYNTAWNRKTSVNVKNSSDQTLYDVQYNYDLAGRMVGIDANDIASQTMQPLAGFNYDTNGNRGRLTYFTSGPGADPNYYINYAYNDDNLLTNIDTAGGSVFSYEAADSGDIDGLGRLKFAAESIAKPGFGTMSHAYEYQYDMLSQLTASKATNIGTYEYVREAFAYNKDGNVTSHTQATKLSGQNETYLANTFVYSSGGDLMTGTGVGSSNPFTLSNDNNGNITRLPTTEPNDKANWNWDNKLKNARKGSAAIAVKYDPMGNRIWRQSTIDGVSTGRKYIVDINGQLPVILCEVDDPNSCTFGSLKTSYIYADGQILSQRIHTVPNDPNVFTPYYYVHDRLGSVRLMLDNSGTAINSYAYKPYGSFYEGEVVEDVYNPWAFTGQYFDAEIDQYYLRARQYDPQMMRFTSRDPLDGQYDEPLMLHKYIYCLNEPMDRIDLSGEMSLPEEEAGLGVQGSLNAASNGYDYANRIKNYAQMVCSGASFQNVMEAALIDCATDIAGGKMLDFVGGTVSGAMNTLKEANSQILSYKNLRKSIKGTDLESHHLIEKRFAGLFGMKGREGDMLAVALTKEQHQKFTNAWRDAIGYGSGTKNASREGVENAAKKIYQGCPEFLAALGLLD